MKLRDIKEKLHAGTVSNRKGVITVRRGFYYTHGRKTIDFIDDIKSEFPDSIIVDSGEVWKSFNPGASLANQSHWFVKFRLSEDQTNES